MSDPMDVDTSSGPSSQVPKPPIVQAIRNGDPLPQIKIKRRHQPKTLHAASESASHVALPKVLVQIDPSRYTTPSDEFIDGNSFNGLIGVGEAMPDPTIIHHNESDVAESISFSINRNIALVLVHGHEPGTFTMETTTQAWKRVVLDDPEPAEPSQIILIPDWHAECKLGPSNEPDECKTSTLVLEYKDRGLTFVDEFIAECKKSDERLDDIADQITDMEQLDREMDRGEGQSRYNFRRLVRNHRHDYVPNLNSNGSTLGLKEPCSFSKNVETVLRQTSTYALADGAPYLGLTDYQTLVMLEYVDLKKKMLENEELRTDDIARLRAGPGIRVDVVPIKDDENQSQIRRVMLGAWLQAIRGL